jgi:hypothetical protein
MQKRAGAGQRERREPASSEFGTLLRELYDSVVMEPVPQRLLDVLRQMEAKARGVSDSTSDLSERKA